MPAFVPSDTYVFAIGLFTVNRRPETKNHILSFEIGPPKVPLVSSSNPILSTNLTPFAARKDERLSLCNELFSYPSKSDPVKRLPPSFGIMLIFTPPVGESTVPPPVW